MDLKLDDIKNADFWKDKSDRKSGYVPFVVVLPSGRCVDACSGHLALISDALYTHEMVVYLERICREGGLKGLNLQCMLDIDYYDELLRIRSGATGIIKNGDDNIINSNLLVLATADINVVTKILLHETKAIETYKIGYRPPYEDCMIVGGKGKAYPVTSYPNVGVLGLFSIPWTQESRVALFCGGVLATGTLAANQLLLKYLKGEASGNNSYNSEVPIRIVSSSVKDYHHVELWPTAKCVPQHELRNITEDIHIHE